MSPWWQQPQTILLIDSESASEAPEGVTLSIAHDLPRQLAGACLARLFELSLW